jgi:hypothetical protein
MKKAETGFHVTTAFRAGSFIDVFLCKRSCQANRDQRRLDCALENKWEPSYRCKSSQAAFDSCNLECEEKG